jgi:hypothetical protein
VRACHHCSRELSLTAAIGRTDSCPHCFSDLKCCLNCRFFDPGMNNQCREPQAEWQTDKVIGNFCEFFDFRESSTIGRPGFGGAGGDRSGPRSAFDALFKKT